MKTFILLAALSCPCWFGCTSSTPAPVAPAGGAADSESIKFLLKTWSPAPFLRVGFPASTKFYACDEWPNVRLARLFHDDGNIRADTMLAKTDAGWIHHGLEVYYYGPERYGFALYENDALIRGQDVTVPPESH